MLPGTPERATHDDKRSGTSSLYAAFDITTGEVIGSLHGSPPEREPTPVRVDQNRRPDPRINRHPLHADR
jgi:hypothetical protein